MLVKKKEKSMSSYIEGRKNCSLFFIKVGYL